MTTSSEHLDSSKKVGKNLKIEAIHYGKYFIILSAIYFLMWLSGYFQINVLWGIVGIFTYIIYHKTMNRQHQKFNLGLDLSKDVKLAIDNATNLPSWVFFPDVERVEWINKIILRLWPNVTMYLNKVVVKNILEQFQKKLSGLKLKEIYFGDIPPKIGGVKLYDSENISREEIIMDVELYHYSPAKISFVYNQLPFGIKGFEVKAQLRIQMSCLIPTIPFCGAVSFTLLQNPHINIEYADMISIFNMPGLRSILRETVDDVIADMIVLPNRINFILNKDIDKTKFMFHIPDGVIRINVIEGSSLKAMDVRVFNQNTSDPYMIVRVGAERFKTKVIKNSLNPRWNETFEAIVDTKSCQKVELEILDKDNNNKDDFLGRVSFDIDSVYERGVFDTWLQLENTDTGSVHLNLSWLDLSSNPCLFNLEEEKIKNTENLKNIGLLYISIDCAKNLPKSSSYEEPDPYIKLSFGNKSVNTNVKKKTCNPVWENHFSFLIQSLLSSILNFQVKDEKSKKIIGTCSFKVEKLLNEPGMDSFLTLKLENTNESNSSIQIHVSLRALSVKKCRTNTLPRVGSVKQSDIEIQIQEDLHINGIGDNTDSVNTMVPVDEVFVTPIHVTTAETSPSNNSKNEKQFLKVNNAIPKVRLTLRYTANKNMFIVVVHNVVNLKVDNDVYVKMSLHPKDKSHGNHKTKSIRNKNELVYDETFEFFVNKENLKISEFVLLFKIDRHSVIKRNTKIGQLKIDLTDFNPSTIKTDWFEIEILRNHRNSDSLSMISNHSEVVLKE